MAKLTVHTTVANYQMRPRYKYVPAIVNYERQTGSVLAVPIDEGFIDYRAFLGAMESGGFEGTVAYEMCSPLRGGGGRAAICGTGGLRDRDDAPAGSRDVARSV